MIKIIEYGTKQIKTCENCGCKFSFEKEDIKGGRGFKEWVICPQCERKIVLMQTRSEGKE